MSLPMKSAGNRGLICSLVALLFLAWMPGCQASEEHPPSFTTPHLEPRPLPGCEAEFYGGCDIRTVECQSAIFSTAACLRESPGAIRPPIRLLTANQRADELRSNTTEADPVAWLAYERCSVLLNLAAPGQLSLASQVEVQTTTVPAYYSHVAKDISFIVPDEPRETTTDSDYISLLHEYIHAIQDQEHDLAEFRRRFSVSTDSSLAIASVAEGEATLHETRFLAAAWGLDPDALDWEARFAAQSTYLGKEFNDLSPLLALPRSFPYLVGGQFVYAKYAEGQMAAVRSLFSAPPLSSEQLTNSIEPNPVLDAAPMPPTGYELLSMDTYGSALLRAALSRNREISQARVEEIASAWLGDRVYYYYVPTTDAVAVAWRIRVATEDARRGLLAWPTSGVAEALGDDVIIAIATPSAVRRVPQLLIQNARDGITIEPDANDEPAEAAAPTALPPEAPRSISARGERPLGFRLGASAIDAAGSR